LITFFFLGLVLGLSLPATAFLHSSRLRSFGSLSPKTIQVLNGRFGPYIWNGKKKGKGQKNITIKKVFGDKEPKDLSLEECKKAVAGYLCLLVLL
jgi:hypothetical protein